MDASKITYIFNKNANPGGKTRAVADFPQREVDSIFTEASLYKNEEPLILCLLSHLHWTLLTSQRLIYFFENKNQSVLLEEVVGTAADQPGLVSFSERNRLQFVLKSGEIFEIECEQGRNCGAFKLAAHSIYSEIQRNSKDSEANDAHKNGIHNKRILEKSDLCGCYYCLEIFTFDQITDWVDKQDTAICPSCGIDSVIGSAQGYPVTREFLNRMKVMWFSDH